jgi:NagD protein
MSTSLQECEAILIDSGGTLVRGGSLIEGAPEFTKALRRKRTPHFVLSNTTISSAVDLCSTLNNLGFAFDERQMITANRSAMHAMRSQNIRSIFVIGTPSQKEEFTTGGFTVVGPHDQQADAVVVSLDEQMNYTMLAHAAMLLRNGAAFIATNADDWWISDKGLLPDTGATIAYLQHLCGTAPLVTGKPSSVMMEYAIAQSGTPAKHMAIIGDQMTSDMQMAQEFGMVSVLVLSGQTTRDDLVNSPYQPDYVVESISHLTPLFQ